MAEAACQEWLIDTDTEITLFFPEARAGI